MVGCISERRSKARLTASLLVAAVLSYGAGAKAAPSAAPSKVTAVHFWSLGDVTRVSIEVSTEFQHHSERLTNPDRLFFDVQGARPELGDKGMRVIAVGDGLLKQIRIAETQKGVTRVVLDLEQRADFTASQLSNPYRLMIELRSKDHPAPPPTASVTGSKALTDQPVQALAADLITVPVAASMPSAVEVLAKPEPKHFEAPPFREEAPRPVAKPDLLPQPSVSLRTPTPVIPSRKGMALPPYEVIAANIPDKSIEKVGDLATERVVTTRPPTGPIAEPAKRNSNGDRSLTRVLGLKLGRVVIDPGHGGHDGGTHGPSGLLEKDVVLDVSRRLGALIEEKLNSEVIFTRADDTFIPLEERTHIANEAKADLFLSIHANSSPYKLVGGVETYYLNFTTSKTALDVAARENASSSRPVFDLKEILQKIALKDKIDESREFAGRVESSLYGLSAKSNPTAKNRGVKKAPFVVLIGASMPSVLAEIGFLTNAGDETLLRKADHRQKIAEALYRGVAGYADTLSHFQVAKRD